MKKYAVLLGNKIIAVVDADEGTPLESFFKNCTFIEVTEKTGEAFSSQTYSPMHKKFKQPKPYKSWIFDEQSFSWAPPEDYPQDGNFYIWSEEEITWKEIDTNV